MLIILMTTTVVIYSQKKKNGTIYSEHPAIDLVEDYRKAFVAGDSEKVMSYLADDFQFWNGNDSNKDAKPGTKEGHGNNVKGWKKNMSYLSIERSSGAYPDAIEYKDENQKDVVWVQTWNHIKGVHDKTGVKIDKPAHRLFVVNSDNKIQTIIDYSGLSDFWSEVRESYEPRENGTIYNHHDYINSVRRMMAALENQDMEKYFSYFHEKARFRNVHMAPGTPSYTMDEEKEAIKSMMEHYDITSIDQQGYPDYLNYGLRDAKVVQSWWNLRMTRKADNEKIVLPLHIIHNFDDEGKIRSDMAYYSLELMTAKSK